MPRRARVVAGDVVYHVLNRAVGRMTLFRHDSDYAAFERVLAEAHQRLPVRIYAYVVMPNHWHLVVHPRRDDDLARFFHWLTMTHAQRWRHARRLVGHGPLYQGRFKCFPIQQDDHLLTVLRYVERNPLRAHLVPDALAWPWSSASRRLRRQDRDPPLLTGWPIDPPSDYATFLQRPQTDAECRALHHCATHGRPFGDPAWTQETATRLHLQHTLRSPGAQKGNHNNRK